MENEINNINNLKTMIEQAKESVIRLKADIQNLEKQQDQLERECVDLYGVTIDEAPEFLNKQSEELQFITSKLNSIGLDNVSIDTITDNQINALNELARNLPSGV